MSKEQIKRSATLGRKSKQAQPEQGVARWCSCITACECGLMPSTKSGRNVSNMMTLMTRP